MQGSLRVISLMFAPCDPHLTFPHLSLHKINPFLAPPHLTSLRPQTSHLRSTTDKIQYTRHRPHWHTTSNTILSTQLIFFVRTLSQRTELFTKLLFPFHWIELFVWFRWKKDMFWSISLKVFPSFVQLQLAHSIILKRYSIRPCVSEFCDLLFQRYKCVYLTMLLKHFVIFSRE